MLNKFKNIDAKSKVLVKNTVMLYLLQFSTYLFSFLTVPYQSRILGPEIYGILGVAGAVMIYFQLLWISAFCFPQLRTFPKTETISSIFAEK